MAEIISRPVRAENTTTDGRCAELDNETTSPMLCCYDCRYVEHPSSVAIDKDCSQSRRGGFSLRPSYKTIGFVGQIHSIRNLAHRHILFSARLTRAVGRPLQSLLVAPLRTMSASCASNLGPSWLTFYPSTIGASVDALSRTAMDIWTFPRRTTLPQAMSPERLSWKWL